MKLTLKPFIVVLLFQLLVTVFKLISAYTLGSFVILSSSIESLVDVIIIGVSMYSFYYMKQPPDKEHRFGHGKMGALFAFSQSLMIIGGVLFLVYEVFTKHGILISLKSGFIWGILALVTEMVYLGIVYMASFRPYVKGMIMDANVRHVFVDFMISIVAYIGFFLYYYFHTHYLDKILALGIIALLLYMNIKLMKRSIEELMDREAPESIRNKIKLILNTADDIKGYHDLRTRMSGETIYVEFHVELSPQITLYKAHLIVEDVMKTLQNQIKNLDIVVHEDPYGYKERRLDEQYT